MVRCRGAGYNKFGYVASGRRVIHDGGGSHRSTTVSSDDDGDVVRTSGRRIIHRGGKSHRPDIVSNAADDVRTYTSGRHIIHRGGGSSGTPRSIVVAAGQSSGRHVVDQVGRADVMADTNRVLHNNELLHELNAIGDNDDGDNNVDPDDDGPRNTPQRPLIVRVGKKFANGEVHRSIRRILNDSFDGSWATFRQVPRDKVTLMFARFKTLWRWDPEAERSIYEAFCNVLKDRFRGIMMEWRKESKKKAREDGHDIGDKEDNFDIICDYPPSLVGGSIWRKLCLYWGSEKWQNKSATGRDNRASADNGDYISRHTSGSMGFEERRIFLEKEKGRKISWLEMFFDTHLTKECKERFWAGELDINEWEAFEFCTERSKETYAAYMKNMIELYGSDLSKHPAGDLDVWKRVQSQGGSRSRIFGIGSSDPHFVVTGTPSTSCGSGSYVDAQRSQKEIQEVRAQMESKLESDRKAREDLEQRVKEMENERLENEERMRKFEEFVIKFQSSTN